MNIASLSQRPLRNAFLSFLIAAGAIGAVALPETSHAAVGVQIVIPAPPAPRVERVPAPRRGYVWVPGYWDWRGHRHVWVPGVWMRERRGYAYHPHRWIERDGAWVLERGRWDRDGDGVPDSRDRHPNNPNRR